MIDDEFLVTLEQMAKRSRSGDRHDRWLFCRVMEAYSGEIIDKLRQFNTIKMEMLDEIDNQDEPVVECGGGARSDAEKKAAGELVESERPGFFIALD